MNKLYALSLVILFFCCMKEPPLKATFHEAGAPIQKNTVSKNSAKAKSALPYLSKEKNRKTILELLEKSDLEGLNPVDYNLKILLEFEKNYGNLTSESLDKYNGLLIQNFQKYISHLCHGKLNPSDLYPDWDLKTNPINLDQKMTQLLKSNNCIQEVERLKPQHLIYKSLKEALVQINTLPEDPSKKIKFIENIKPNQTDTTLIDIKKKLIYWKDLQPLNNLTPLYDSKTIEGMKRFQFRNGLSPDGIIGIKTVTALNFTKEQRKQQIVANLERWRWFPRNLGPNYILINIPDYSLILIKNQDTVRTHKAIVGRAERKTPVLSSTLTQIIFNPTWTIPPTILKEDIIPAILKDKNYLTAKNIKLYDYNDSEVKPENWKPAKAKSYRYIQTSGTSNTLGTVKFIFPNRFTVYLHDTNHRDFFEKINRSLSSGCVRINDPIEFTQEILEDPVYWNLEKITEVLKNEKTIQIKIPKKYNIHLLYWTAWSKNSQLYFLEDIYNLDFDLYAKLRS